MNEYRCTRNFPYRAGDCPGNMDSTARQGYYIRANNEREALKEMVKRFPDDVKNGYWFTVQLWQENM